MRPSSCDALCNCSTQNIKAFKQLFVTVMSLLNPNGSTTLYSSTADDVIDLETSLAKVILAKIFTV